MNKIQKVFDKIKTLFVKNHEVRDMMSEVKEILVSEDKSAISLDDLESAVVGVWNDDDDNCHIVYSEERIIQALESQDMTEEEAWDWYSYNTVRTLPYTGVTRPIIIRP